ncbi:MAG TPA: nuclear transport factor 2 family protein [Oscillatoriaceae cyanobacterium M33_DOE_052]|uniref:Nuclear transport factor 2 family protein n=1 Tax=Planktothricoides sp. SpSt-374 TaxID=2282167 RepID=A0A7C3VS11_9CYAN|nr:nuclear transport factor 2 family protein [Oscillatoriaceae cyanobacterium M33_DOE_052]
MTQAKTPGQAFFDKHLERIGAGEIDAMVDSDYTPDAVLITFFNGFDDEEPPMTVKGREGIKQFFHKYMKTIGSIDVKKIDFTENFDGKEGSIFFQAEFTCDLGLMKVGDAWTMKDGQIFIHYGFWASDKPKK